MDASRNALISEKCCVERRFSRSVFCRLRASAGNSKAAHSAGIAWYWQNLRCREAGGLVGRGIVVEGRGFRASDCAASETGEARLRARAETGQTWQPSYSRPTLSTACEVVDFRAGQDCDKAHT